MDTSELYRRANERVGGLVEAVPDDGWDAPTPCAAWSVRDLVNHLAGEQRWLVPLLAGATIEEVGDRFDAAHEEAYRSVGAVAGPPPVGPDADRQGRLLARFGRVDAWTP